MKLIAQLIIYSQYIIKKDLIINKKLGDGITRLRNAQFS